MLGKCTSKPLDIPWFSQIYFKHFNKTTIDYRGQENPSKKHEPKRWPLKPSPAPARCFLRHPAALLGRWQARGTSGRAVKLSGGFWKKSKKVAVLRFLKLSSCFSMPFQCTFQCFSFRFAVLVVCCSWGGGCWVSNDWSKDKENLCSFLAAWPRIQSPAFWGLMNVSNGHCSIRNKTSKGKTSSQSCPCRCLTFASQRKPHIQKNHKLFEKTARPNAHWWLLAGLLSLARSIWHSISPSSAGISSSARGHRRFNGGLDARQKELPQSCWLLEASEPKKTSMTKTYNDTRLQIS